MIKVKYEKEIHIFKIEEGSWEVESLKMMVREAFRNKPGEFHFGYIDEEGDEIEVISDEDLQTVLELELTRMAKSPKNVVKLIVKEDLIQDLYQEVSISEQAQPSSFQLLNSKQPSQYESLNSSECLSSLQLLMQEEQEKEQINIAEIVRDNLAVIEQKCVEEAMRQIEDRLVKQEIEMYLNKISQEIASQQWNESDCLEGKIQVRQNNFICNKQSEEQQLTSIVQKSLKKLLPSFIKRLSQKTIQTVKQLLREEQTYQFPA